jgi:hypothetical protein
LPVFGDLFQLQDAGLSASRINLELLVLKMILRTAVRRRPSV